MPFYSTNNPSSRCSLEEAVLSGLAPDGGLFMPVKIEKLPEAFLTSNHRPSFLECCKAAAKAIIGSDIDSKILSDIIGECYPFDAPLVELASGLYTLELFHGPTFAFKDFGARFLAALTGHFIKSRDKELRVLVATSGDTGSAVASAFLGQKNTRVILLYPSKKVSLIQEKQLTTMGGNVTALEVEGTFDDCQSLVKQAFVDRDLQEISQMTSANSINIARLIPQSFYYIYAYFQLRDRSLPLVFSVPSGNFGNLTAGLLAKRMGLPISCFVAATNINDAVPRYLRTGVYEPHATKSTISNAMDVGKPNNFSRLLDLYDNKYRPL